ncbi:MAG: LPS export ABC transporter periplasmic protein LptC [Pseudomonadota bacterium]
MARRNDGYTRMVSALRVLLPLGALGLLSTLFFFSGEVDPTQSIPYAELDVERLAEEQRVSSPYFAGVTEDGTAITLTGTSVIPDLTGRDRFTLETMDARLETADDVVLTAQALTAEIDNEIGRARLEGDTVLETSDGMRVETAGLDVDLGTADLATHGPVEAEAPFGRVTADRMEMTRPSADAPHRIVFQGAVRLLYQAED